ncbi:hypothetical protein V5O48_006015 [Marasmius crinis-equi]|uniref:Uncharacterized protein n=1 Tax=Marasmius crinis-equi TaxID=585013 RepID=A0ABR3FKP0_9AGAR
MPRLQVDSDSKPDRISGHSTTNSDGEADESWEGLTEDGSRSRKLLLAFELRGSAASPLTVPRHVPGIQLCANPDPASFHHVENTEDGLEKPIFFSFEGRRGTRDDPVVRMAYRAFTHQMRTNGTRARPRILQVQNPSSQSLSSHNSPSDYQSKVGTHTLPNKERREEEKEPGEKGERTSLWTIQTVSHISKWMPQQEHVLIVNVFVRMTAVGLWDKCVHCRGLPPGDVLRMPWLDITYTASPR